MKYAGFWKFVAGVALIAVAGCGDNASQSLPQGAPEFLREFETAHAGRRLSPIRLTVEADTLWVGFQGSPLIQAYSLDLEPVAAVALDNPYPVNPTSFVVRDSMFAVTDHRKGMVAIFDRSGKMVESFDSLPDGRTRLSPLDLVEHDGILYVADISIRRVLAIAHQASEGLRDRGELLLMIPHDAESPVGFPSAVALTDDGRLLVGDARDGIVQVFTCDGRPVYRFEPVPGIEGMAPQGFAQDNVRDESLQDESSMDPSGIRRQGHYHVVDGLNKRVHVFNPLGKYVYSYPRTDELGAPSDIAIDPKSRRIYIADPEGGRIVVYRYGSPEE